MYSVYLERKNQRPQLFKSLDKGQLDNLLTLIIYIDKEYNDIISFKINKEW